MNTESRKKPDSTPSGPDFRVPKTEQLRPPTDSKPMHRSVTMFEGLGLLILGLLVLVLICAYVFRNFQMFQK